MLYGVDISKWQPKFNDFKRYDFVIMKASEGKTMKDSSLDRHYDTFHGSKDGKPDKNKLYGFYHYAHPELNDFKSEADNFLKHVKHHRGNCMFILDWEGKAISNDKNYSGWAFSWLNYVYKETGVRPLIYLQQSEAKKARYEKIAKADFGLWIARYNSECLKKKSPYLKDSDKAVWKTWAMWQYSDSGLDLNMFNGGKDQFRKYCEKK